MANTIKQNSAKGDSMFLQSVNFQRYHIQNLEEELMI